MKTCDNKSVGMIIRKADAILLIERKKFPFGFACPAGHVDEFGSPENAARGETKEEVGLDIESLTLVSKGRRENTCRREGGDHHYWWIYEVVTSGDVTPGKDEVKQFGWYDITQIHVLASLTRQYRRNEISEEEWQRSPGLEPIWYDWFLELGIIEQ